MPLLTRKTLRNGAIGGVIGAALGFVPLIRAVRNGATPHPQFNHTQVECMYGQQERHRCFEHDTRVYATYGAPEDTTVYVSAQLTGRNEGSPASGRATSTGSQAHTELLGPGRGWYFVRGELEVGSGRYRG